MKFAIRAAAFAVPYMGFELTDGAIRMLVILHFNALGFDPFQIAALFLLYEIAGIVTNFIGGWLGSTFGLDKILVIGLFVQVAATAMMIASNSTLTVLYVMIAQGLSGVAKDLVKVGAKTSLKFLVPEGADSDLFRWVSIITGSKNAMKGFGFLLGGLMMTGLGLQTSMLMMSVTLAIATFVVIPTLPKQLGRAKKRVKVSTLFSKSSAINVLSAARFFLFGSRDVWFVIGLPVYLQEVLGWNYTAVAFFLASWIVGYGIAQSVVSRFFRGADLSVTMGSAAVAFWTGNLLFFPLGIVVLIKLGFDPGWVLVIGLMGYGIYFAVNSIIHSYLVLLYSDRDKAAADVGFYYMANAGGRLAGTLMSGWVYRTDGLIGCLLWSAGFLASAAMISLWLPPLSRSAAVSELEQTPEDAALGGAGGPQ
jgi:predicted MFS family arabinose efflux permease